MSFLLIFLIFIIDSMWSKIKFILLLVLLIITGVFVYFKIQVMGDSNSYFNQHARYKLAKSGFWRWSLGLKNVGDARADFLGNTGPIVIEWFKPVSEDLDDSVLQDFSKAVQTYTGRSTRLVFGGGVNDSTVPLSILNSFQLKGQIQKPVNGSILIIYFTKDYLPRQSAELSTTFKENGIIISLDAHKQFLEGYIQNINQYLGSSLLHEFGHQIGLNHSSDPDCIMSLHAGISGRPLEFYGRTAPADFCAKEQAGIQQLKTEYKN